MSKAERKRPRHRGRVTDPVVTDPATREDIAGAMDELIGAGYVRVGRSGHIRVTPAGAEMVRRIRS